MYHQFTQSKFKNKLKLFPIQFTVEWVGKSKNDQKTLYDKNPLFFPQKVKNVLHFFIVEILNI